MTQAEKLEALVRMVEVPVISKAVPELGDTFPVDDSKMVATYLIVNHRVTQLLFNQDFAKALFGSECLEELHETTEGTSTYKRCRIAFKYHLQQAVILPTPSEQVDYMYKAVFGDERND